MTITYSDGREQQAVLVSQTENTLRAIIEGTEDVTEFHMIRGTWVSEDCEPARIEFAWQKRGHKPATTEADCCCSHELAAKLIHLLFSGDDVRDAVALAAPPVPRAAAPLKYFTNAG